MAVSEYVPSAQRDYEFEGQKGRSGARGARQEDDRKPKRKQGGNAKTAKEVKAHRRPARGGWPWFSADALVPGKPGWNLGRVRCKGGGKS